MTATARYNFVSLSSRILPSPIETNIFSNDEERQNSYVKYVRKNGIYSGYIDLEMITKTPCFIGRKEKDSTFFSPVNGRPIIPGSSIRGMIKNIFKIVTSSAMRSTKDDADFNDKKLYYRAVGARGPLAQDYRNELVININRGGQRSSKTKASAGYLARKTDGSYWMFPVSFEVLVDHQRKSASRECKKGAFIPDYNTGEADVFSGFMNNKKHYARFSSIKKIIKPFRVNDEAIINYQEDVTRGEDFDLLSKTGLSREDTVRFMGTDEYEYVTSCFYLPISDRQPHIVKSMGHNMFYRIQYRKSIGEHVPEAVKEDKIDFADAIFGKKELWGSRVFFEDAESVGEVHYEDEEYIKELLGPKPTSYQFYLKQQPGTNTPDNWNSNAEIRGYKMYWHQPNGVDWHADRRRSAQNNERRTDEDMDRVTQKIRPVAEGTIFRGKIRFERLSEIELGALMMVFKLPLEDEDCCFKIGKGKAVGLGSIRVNSSLHIFNEEDGYKNLFGKESIWNEAVDDGNYVEYTNAFIAYKDHIFNASERASYDIAQAELVKLLDWRNTNAPNWMSRIAQMENGCSAFRNREVLQETSQV